MDRPLDSIVISGRAAPSSARAIALWLLACAAMIFVTVVIGGITRLTESGLSITEWRPLTGAIPPLSEAEWVRLFALYRQIPEYRAVHPDMTIESFRTIFWWEYVHRLWDRLIALAFALPFLYFALRRRISRPLAWRLGAMLALGAIQGALGWYMVRSGLAERIDVSQYRLTAHLLLALAIYGFILWTALDLLARGKRSASGAPASGWRLHLAATAVLIVLTITFGGFVAGLDAGRIYNTFPLMGGRLVPSDALALEPAWINPFENPALAQLVHRVLAILTLCLALGLWAHAKLSRELRLPPAAFLPIGLLAFMAVVQVGLGIATLLLVVPIGLAAAHQAGAVVLLSLVVWTAHAAQGSVLRLPGAAPG